MIVENAVDLAGEREIPDILCSALTQDCIGRGKTIKEGGAIYDFISGLQIGIANMADSLAAIKKLVYEEKKITPEQLWNAMQDDFEGEDNQRIQKMLINDYTMEARGLWRMKGDFMGGPFVSHTRLDQKNQRIITAEIFVYSPDKMKRNLVRQMEASLYTLKLPQEGQQSQIPLGVTREAEPTNK